MSLDIALYNSADEEVAAMNWLRNPFGLCQWAEDNVGDGEQSLYFVCNAWTYDEAVNVNRVFFKRVVDAYWERIQVLERGYYCFNLSAYIQFVEGNAFGFPRTKWRSIVDAEYAKDGTYIKIPMEYFVDPVFHLAGYNTLDHYKEWFTELVEFAELLQDESLRFECDN